MNDSEALTQSIIALTQELVRVPSQGGEDDLGPIQHVLGAWLSSNGVRWETLKNDGGKSVGILVTVDSFRPGASLCLDAPIDTAPVGRLDAWEHPPFSATVDGNRMFGRGVADAKVAVAIFCHIARELQRTAHLSTGVLYLLLDGDEHTGNFGGVKAFAEGRGIKPSFAAVGYPGNNGIVIGARGFYRAKVLTYGHARHSGARSDNRRDNAVLKMSHFLQHLDALRLPTETDQDFKFGPKISVTEINGGAGFTQIPSSCEAKIDVRLTPSFGVEEAKMLLQKCLGWLDHEWPTGKLSALEEVGMWPCYRLDRGSHWVRILRESAQQAFAKRIYPVVCGPSNIGNYLAARGVPATCGFGVTYDNIHAANEFIEMDTIEPVYRTYLQAVCRWADEPAVELTLGPSAT